MDWDADTLAPEAMLRASAADATPDDLLSEIVAEGLRCGASRVHLEPRDGELHVRFRIGGRLVEALRLPWGAIAGLESGIQRIHGRDISVAIMPVGEWQRIVLHLGAPQPQAEGLEALGMRPPLVQALSVALARGSGLVLVAGPPGSGKRRTLDALMRHLDNGARCLLGIEAGWGAVLRQDPDVILAGTIATRESAGMAVQAAEAGHLVLAAVEASDAIGAIMAMRQFRVESFRLASTLQAVIAQRLVQRLCPDCREPVQAQGSVSALLGFDPGAVVYAAAGCASCGDTGFAGRTGVFEAIHADAALRRLINDGGDGAIIGRHAFINAPNLGSSARALVREGITTPEEAVRVSRSQL